MNRMSYLGVALSALAVGFAVRTLPAAENPVFSKVARPSPDAFKCLVVFGLYTHVLRIDDALADWRYQGKSRPVITWANCPPNAVESFPGTYDELFRYNAVVLSDVNYKAVGEIGFEMIRDYWEQGGGQPGFREGRPGRQGDGKRPVRKGPGQKECRNLPSSALVPDPVHCLKFNLRLST